MRNRLFRILVAALVALIVPIQGIASVTTGQCMSLEHHQAAAAANEGHQHDGHDHNGHDHASDDQAAAGDSMSNADDGGAKGSHCGPCTACCASATIAGSAGLPLPVPASHSPYFSSQSLPPSVKLEGLDRPPLAL